MTEEQVVASMVEVTLRLEPLLRGVRKRAEGLGTKEAWDAHTLIEGATSRVLTALLNMSTADLTVVETRTCHICGTEGWMVLEFSKVEAWREGNYVQNVWPELNAGLREQLISGTHPECWFELFGDGDPEPDEDREMSDAEIDARTEMRILEGD
jgi:hypothetical protein